MRLLAWCRYLSFGHEFTSVVDPSTQAWTEGHIQVLAFLDDALQKSVKRTQLRCKNQQDQGLIMSLEDATELLARRRQSKCTFQIKTLENLEYELSWESQDTIV